MRTVAMGSGLLARNDQSRVLIAGTHRSGTSWLGQTLGKDPATTVLYEPFNKESGIVGVDHWLPISSADNPRYFDLVQSFYLTRKERFRAFRPGQPVWSSLLRLVLPDERQRIYLKALRRPPPRLVIKDPLATLTAEHLITRFGFKVVFTVKHPFAFYDSLLRVGWHRSLPIADLQDQSPGIFDDRLDLPASTLASKAAAVWTIINASAISLSATYPDQVMIVRHEDICRSPDEEIGRVARFIDMDYSEAMRAYVRATTSGQDIMPDRSIIFSFERNAAALPNRWAGNVNPQDCDDLRRGTSWVSNLLYPEVATA